MSLTLAARTALNDDGQHSPRPRCSDFLGIEELKYIFEPHRGKTNVLVSDLVRHKPGCTATEDG